MSSTTPSRIGALLPDEPVGRRSALLLGGLGLTGAWGLHSAAGDLAHARPRRAVVPPDLGLPVLPAAPTPGAPAQEPTSSGAIGRWQTSTHQASTPEEDATATRHDGIHLVGDSIGSRLLPALQTKLGERPSSYDVWNGRPTAPALDALEQTARRQHLAPTVLAVLGSNDVFDPWHFEALIHRARQIVGDRRLLWVTPFVSRPVARSADMRNSAVLCLALERAAAAGQVELVRWFELLARSADRLAELTDDGVHPTEAGAAALADLVLTTLG